MESRFEIDVQRLLGKCELIAKSQEKEKCENWRFKKYVECLEEMLNELKLKDDKPSIDIMNSYFKRLAFLKGVLNVQQVETPLDKVIALQLAPKGNLNEDTKELHHFTNESISTQLRDELLSINGDSVRRRKIREEDDSEKSNDLDALLKYHHNMQEKIADEMLVLAKNIKEQSVLAGKIIRSDTTTMEKASSLADKNIEQLKKHSDKLQENNKKSWQCWVWVLVIIVFVVFVNMVLLMRVMKKKS